MDFVKKHFHYLILLLTYYGLPLLIKRHFLWDQYFFNVSNSNPSIYNVPTGTRGFGFFPIISDHPMATKYIYFNESIGVYSVFYGAVSVLGILWAT